MEVRYPDYYKKFHCIAGACPDTCCAGWEISVDRASEKRYRQAGKWDKDLSLEFTKKLKKYIKHGQILSDGATCPFLNQEGLCEMYLELGPDSLCETCARHPRHMEDYGALHEMVLLLSCPEVSRLVLESKEDGWHVRKFPNRHGNMEGIDEKLLQLLLQVREQIWRWNGDRSMSLKDCLLCSVALAHDVQRRLRTEDYGGAKQVLRRYRVPDVAGRLKKQSEVMERFFLMSDWMEELAELEVVCRDFPELLEKTRKRLYHSADSRTSYEARRTKLKEENSEWKNDLGRVFSYYIYSFLLSALYDGDLLSKVKMAALLVMAQEECYMAESLEGELNLEMRVKICHALARQVENSDENRTALEHAIRKHFRSDKLLKALF